MKRFFLTEGFMLALLVIAGGCKSQYEELLSGYDTEAKYDAAFEYFNNGKYDRAAQLFESLSVVTSGTMRDDTVQFYWGLSNYNQKDYVTAQTNFESFLANYPRSVFSDQAKFLNIDCLYRSTLRYELDQSPSYRAITAISEYIIEYPSSPNVAVCKRMMEELELRIQRKAYEGAKLYYTMEDYKAARIALRNVLKDNSENAYREEILYYTAMASFKYASNSVEEKKRERFMIFIDDYFNFVGEYPESRYRKELDGLYSRIQK